MKSRFTVAPKIAHARHHQRKDRRQKRLQIVANEKIFLFGFADDSCGINRVAPMSNCVAVKDRIVVLKRIISVMIAKWTFASSLVRRRVTDQSELGLCD